LNKPAWGNTGGTGDNGAWGAPKQGLTPIAQKTSTGPVWGAKPTGGNTFGSGAPTWGNGTGSTFGSGMNKNLTVNTATRPTESSPNTAGPENIPESAVEIKHVPAPGLFSSSIVDKKEETVETQDDAWGWTEATGTKGSKKSSKVPSPTEERPPEPQAEVTEEPERMEETNTPATPAEDEFDWVNPKKKKGQVASVAQTPSAPNTPDPDNADDGTGGGGGGGGGNGGSGKKKGKKKGKK